MVTFRRANIKTFKTMFNPVWNKEQIQKRTEAMAKHADQTVWKIN
jgi:hypothetical protein